jgi:type IV pilus assembly protein PilC
MKGAMVYPAIVLGSAFVMMLAILTFIVPQLQNVYGEAGAELPKITLVIVAISEFITGKWKFLLVSILSVILGLFVFLKTPTGKKVFDKIVLSLPVFGTIAKQNNMMLFTSNLSILMINGIHIGEALLVVSRVLPNYYYQQIVVQIRERMIDLGGSLSIAMDTPEIRKFFSQEVLQTVNAGEQTGKLAEMMEGSGNMIKEQIKNSVKALSETIEPFMIIGVGIVIAIILISVMFPLFNLRNVLGR